MSVSETFFLYALRIHTVTLWFLSQNPHRFYLAGQILDPVPRFSDFRIFAIDNLLLSQAPNGNRLRHQ